MYINDLGLSNGYWYPDVELYEYCFLITSLATRNQLLSMHKELYARLLVVASKDYSLEMITFNVWFWLVSIISETRF